ncbi:MAG TPA: glutathione S-transferase N-terminal domain-containing protein [Burkholderiales bacterium]|jgi:glutathione S-transferase|nr:glutathione S-transferase N-terminal domain-containing protein [Burkholderiales bacterium]
MKLLASPASPYTRKVRVVLAEKKIDFDMELVDVAPAVNPVNPYNPLGKIPTLALDDGTALYDSRVIVEFLDHASPLNRLIPADFRDRMQVRRWEALADGVVDAGILVRGGFQLDKQVARMHRGMARLEAELGAKNWCHGERYSLADIAVGCCVGWLGFRKPGDVDWPSEYPALARHYQKLLERPAFADTAPR